MISRCSYSSGRSRDIDSDGATGKRTLAVILGPRRTVVEYDLLLGAAYAIPVALVLSGDASIAALLPLASAPMALALLRVVHAQGDPRRLNPVLRETARLSLLFLCASAGFSFYGSYYIMELPLVFLAAGVIVTGLQYSRTGRVRWVNLL